MLLFNWIQITLSALVRILRKEIDRRLLSLTNSSVWNLIRRDPRGAALCATMLAVPFVVFIKFFVEEHSHHTTIYALIYATCAVVLFILGVAAILALALVCSFFVIVLDEAPDKIINKIRSRRASIVEEKEETKRDDIDWSWSVILTLSFLLGLAAALTIFDELEKTKRKAP